ncbi:hypothetical protein [Oryza sativa Japonica Group]|uniref:Uncharacterized protein n=1 Tax=Oryza sativa subsp. japonica TaxID=39947 RepID=Q9FU85_ORYSJ|nr:hypothetical protein [Oryza sativa Japonica Group]BAB40114.1 hypothetical protein [Oryza sativa Japonica Group]
MEASWVASSSRRLCRRRPSAEYSWKPAAKHSWREDGPLRAHSMPTTICRYTRGGSSATGGSETNVGQGSALPCEQDEGPVPPPIPADLAAAIQSQLDDIAVKSHRVDTCAEGLVTSKFLMSPSPKYPLLWHEALKILALSLVKSTEDLANTIVPVTFEYNSKVPH